MKRTKLLNLISSMLMGVVFMIAILLVMVLSGAISIQRTELVFSTASSSAVYDGKPLTNHKWELISGELKAGHRVNVTFTGKQTDVGESENSIKVKILDAADADVTGDYIINYNLGKLKVSPRTVTVTSASASKLYDGTPLMNPEYEISQIIPGHKAVVLVIGAQTNVGFSPNTIGMVKIIDRLGADVTNNYVITKNEGPLVVTDENSQGGTQGGVDFSGITAGDPEELKKIILYKVYSDKTGRIYLKTKSFGNYTGSGFTEASAYSALISGKYSASYLTTFALQAKGAGKGSVTIRPQNGAAYALPYYIDSYESNGYNIQTSDTEVFGSAKEYTVGYYMNDVTPAAHTKYLYMSYEKTYREFVHANYLEIDAATLEYMQGIINREGFSISDENVIENVAKYIQGSAQYNFNYDTSLDRNNNIAIAFLRDYKEGVCRHYAMAATMLYRALGIPARYTVGAVADAMENEWVDVNALMSHAWVEVYVDGIGWQMVEVTGGTFAEGGSGGAGGSGGSGENEKIPDKSIAPKNVYMRYNGTTLYAKAELENFEKYAALGYTYKNLVVSGSRKEVGISQSIIENIVIYDAEGNDVTDEFKLVKGKVHVYLWEITASSNSGTFIYGDPIEQKVDISGEWQDHTPQYKFSAKHTAGTHTNIFTVKILDGDGKDITDRYKINMDYGTLQIEQRKITVTAASAEKVYDGTPLTCNEYEISGMLAEGDRVYICVVSGSKINIGSSYNIIESFHIQNAEGIDVTDNYCVEKLNGILRVKRKK